MSTRVLVVDDDPAIRRAISLALSRDGFDVTSADDAESAITQAETTRPDIVVVDYNMPTCGLEVVRRVRQTRTTHVFVAVLTGDDDDTMRAVCIDAGADVVMTKPVTPKELRRRLSQRE